MKKVTPLITVREIEPCLLFWTALGLELVASVPHDGVLGFAMLVKGDVTLMYQTGASVAADLGAAGAPESLASDMMSGTATLFVEVESLDAAIEATHGAEVLVPRRKTFYGMEEIFVRAPCGTVVGFAQQIAGAGEDDADTPA